MTERCHPDLHRLAESAAVDSPTAFTLLGHRVEVGADQLLRVLESELYLQLYAGSADRRSPQTEDPAESQAFIAALSAANTGDGTWEPGWRISGEEEGCLTAIREGVTFRVERGQVRTATGGFAPGEECAVRIGKEMRHLLFGFYLAQGNLHPGGEPKPPLIRLYWHLTPAGAVRYMREATLRLNGAGIPLQTKVVANPHQYLRRDSGVLYLRKADFVRAAPLLREIWEAVRTGLLPDVPLFTKPLGPGLSLAEDPPGGISFGQSRCRVAARGLWQGFQQGLTTPEQRLDAIAGAFRAAGLDPEHPYLEPTSTDIYVIDLKSGGEGG